MSDENPPNSEERLRTRFVRWQRELRRNLGSHVALVVSWSAGALVFCGALLRDKSAQFGGVATLMFLATSFLFIGCLAIALFISWNRLCDTRATLRILDARRNGESTDIIAELQAQADALGKRTWRWAGAQLWLFGIASLIFFITMIVSFRDRLHLCPCSDTQTISPTPAVSTPAPTLKP